MFGLHLPDLIIVIAIGLIVLGPKALQSIARDAGKGMGQAKSMKDKVLSELPMEEISKVSQTISKIPTSPNQAIQMLLTSDKQEEQKQEIKKE